MSMEPDSRDDLLILARRGGLPELEQRRLREVLSASEEMRLLYQAGCAFDREAPVFAGDDERIERMVRAVERRRSPLQRLRPLRHVAYGMALGVVIAGLAMAAMDRLRAPSSSSRPATRAAPNVSAPNPALVSAPAVAPTNIVPKLDEPTPSASSAATPPVPGHRANSLPAASTDDIAGGTRALAPEAPALGPAPPTAKFDALSEPTASGLFSAANSARVRGDAPGALALYQRLEATFPKSSEATTAHLSLGVLYLRQGQAKTALQEFQQSAAAGGATPEALWGEAQALRQLGRNREERTVLDQLLQRFPSSAYSTAARKRQADLD